MPFLFCFVLFFVLSHSVAVAAWSGIQRVDPQMIYFELFLSSGAQEPVQPPPPKQYLLRLVSLKYIIIYIDLGIHLKKDNHPGPLPRAKLLYFVTNLRRGGRYLAD